MQFGHSPRQFLVWLPLRLVSSYRSLDHHRIAKCQNAPVQDRHPSRIPHLLLLAGKRFNDQHPHTVKVCRGCAIEQGRLEDSVGVLSATTGDPSLSSCAIANLTTSPQAERSSDACSTNPLRWRASRAIHFRHSRVKYNRLNDNMPETTPAFAILEWGIWLKKFPLGTASPKLRNRDQPGVSCS